MKIDVLIIGCNLAGLLTSYIFFEKDISVAIVERNHLDKQTNIQEETEIILNDYQTIDFFQLSLEGLYKLCDIIKHLDNDCELIRRPVINLKVNKVNNEKYLTFPFEYKANTTLNASKLMNGLLNYHRKHEILIYENCEIREIEINQGVIVNLDNNVRIKCKKLLLCDVEFSELYFDLPKYHTDNKVYSFLETPVNLNISIDGKENTIEYKYYLSPLLTNIKELSYVGIHKEYSQVYFNLTNNDILYSVIGAKVLRNKYLNIKDDHFKILQLVNNY